MHHSHHFTVILLCVWVLKMAKNHLQKTLTRLIYVVLLLTVHTVMALEQHLNHGAPLLILSYLTRIIAQQGRNHGIALALHPFDDWTLSVLEHSHLCALVFI